MLSYLFAGLIFAQAAAPTTVEQDRLQVCMDQARSDPASSIATANEWLEGSYGPQTSAPQQCLGFAFTSLLRWEAAREAFTKARDAASEEDRVRRARLGAMAANAALAGSAYQAAADLLNTAQADAAASGNGALAGEIAADRARALVGLERADEAASALERARELAPQDAQVWLLSATLARRQGELETAQAWIETADALAPENLAVLLEAGLIAALAGRDDVARTTWQSVVLIDAESPEAAAARSYIEQLEGVPPAP